jgi:hypothetical protein
MSTVALVNIADGSWALLLITAYVRTALHYNPEGN